MDSRQNDVIATEELSQPEPPQSVSSNPDDKGDPVERVNAQNSDNESTMLHDETPGETEGVFDNGNLGNLPMGGATPEEGDIERPLDPVDERDVGIDYKWVYRVP